MPGSRNTTGGKISDIENQLTAFEEKFPDIAGESVDDAMSVPADSDMAADMG